MTKPLSPSAQAVMDAFENASDGEYVEGVWVVNERTMIAAALRAAADQVVPSTYAQLMEDYELGVWVANDDTRTELLAIASELENQ
jgi:phage terminase Nu1 subunit (DNA packaging protein)